MKRKDLIRQEMQEQTEVVYVQDRFRAIERRDIWNPLAVLKAPQV